MANTKKTNATKKTTKKAVEAVPAKQEEPTVSAPKKVRIKHDPDEFISCRSVTKGELIYVGRKTDTQYSWADYGDEYPVEYQDLRPLLLTRSAFLFKPHMIVEDSDLLSEEEWKPLRELYQKIADYDNIDHFLSLPVEDFRMAMLAAPEGIRESMKTAIASKIDEGTFDSIQKIKIVDQILGSDLMCMIE